MDDSFDLSRREFMIGGLVGLSGLPSDIQPQLEPQNQDDYEFTGAAFLLGPKSARPSKGDPFYDNNLVYTYIYRTIAGDTYYTTDDMDSWQSLIKTAISYKAHKTDAIPTPALDAWTDVTGFTTQTGESPNGYVTLQADSTTFEFQEDGLYRFNGCLKMQNNTTGQQTARVLVRLYTNQTTELRCSQRQWLETINTNSQVTFPYGGTDVITAGDTMTLQYYTDNDSISFDADDLFKNPVTATFSADYLGPLP